jgi:gentisate 1,2-dioxygenase
VVEGKMGALLGDDVVVAEVGDLVHKPRNQWHTFWNAGDEPCRILEIIAPAGFEDFFRELDALGGALQAPPEELAALNERYGLEMQPDSVPGLLERFGLVIGERL